MKTKAILLLLAVFAFGAMSFKAKSSAGTKKYYTYCYAASHESKTLYVSSVLHCYFDAAMSKQTTISKKNAAKSSLDVKWNKKVDNYSGGDYIQIDNVMYWDDSFDDVDEDRDDIIAEYKKDGYKVKYISTFSFDCD